METVPDVWVVLKIEKPDQEPIYKILAGWMGGYLHGDSWKINSGITKVEESGPYWLVSGYSGSIYKCAKESERFSSYTYSIFDSFVYSIAERGEGFSMTQVDSAEVFGKFIGTLAQG